MDAASGPCKGKGSDEQTLFRGLLDALKPGDVLLGDAYFPTYFLLGDLARHLLTEGVRNGGGSPSISEGDQIRASRGCSTNHA